MIQTLKILTFLWILTRGSVDVQAQISQIPLSFSKTESQEVISAPLTVTHKDGITFLVINAPKSTIPHMKLRIRNSNSEWQGWQALIMDIHQNEHDDEGLESARTMMVALSAGEAFQLGVPSTIVSNSIIAELYHDTKPLTKTESFSTMPGCVCESILYKSRVQWNCPEGAESPQWLPVISDAKTFVVHHQAGTANAPYDATVRGIWAFHTYSSGNGWGDIGYNWLIAPDGFIYQGRAWVADQFEEVRGAHMCACNSNKIGICLLGDLTNNQPTQKAYEALVKLIGAKACQFNIEPDTTTITPIREVSGCVDKSAPNIIGHKHGCPTGYTACPGDAFAPMIEKLRDDVAEYVSGCASTTKDELDDAVFLVPNPVSNLLSMETSIPYDHIHIINAYGHLVKQLKVNEGLLSFTIDVGDLLPGSYFVKCIERKGKVRLERFVKM